MPKHKVLAEHNIVKEPRYKQISKRSQVEKPNAGPTQGGGDTNSKNKNYESY